MVRVKIRAVFRGGEHNGEFQSWRKVLFLEELKRCSFFVGIEKETASFFGGGISLGWVFEWMDRCFGQY